MAYGNQIKQKNKKLKRGPKVKLSPGVEKALAEKAASRAAKKMNNLFPGSVEITSRTQKYGMGSIKESIDIFNLYHNPTCDVKVFAQLPEQRVKPVYVPEHVVEIQKFRARRLHLSI